MQETIAGGIADISAFQTDPEFFAYGMLWALLVGGLWQIGASRLELNVSATHSIIGAIVGFAMAYKVRGRMAWALALCSGVFPPSLQRRRGGHGWRAQQQQFGNPLLFRRSRHRESEKQPR